MRQNNLNKTILTNILVILTGWYTLLQGFTRIDFDDHYKIIYCLICRKYAMNPLYLEHTLM